MEDFYQKYSKLLQEFDSLPRLKISKSIFDVTGYSHYENIASNILAFYFDPDNEHGLDDLLLRSLISLANSEEVHINNVEVGREVSTRGGGRIDFRIITDDQIIGIENKIFSKLHNDLEDYSSSIDHWVKDSGKDGSIKIVLSIRELECGSGFINIIFSKCCAKIRENMGKYANTSSQKWSLYLIDFLTNLEKLGGKGMEINRNDRFFIDNHHKIESLIEARKIFTQKLHSKVDELEGLCSEVKELNECYNQWKFQNICLVHEYNLSRKAAVKLDLFISSSGWELSILSVNHESTDHLVCLLETNPLFEKGIKDKGTYESYGSARYLLVKYELTTALDAIAADLLNWSKLLIEADNNYDAKHKENN